METALAAGRLVAAAVLAVQCAIACSDAVCIARLAQRSAAGAHHEAADLLASAGAPGAADKAEQLRRILDLKYAAEYDDRNLSPSEIKALVDRTRRLHGWMTEVLETAAR